MKKELQENGSISPKFHTDGSHTETLKLKGILVRLAELRVY